MKPGIRKRRAPRSHLVTAALALFSVMYLLFFAHKYMQTPPRTVKEEVKKVEEKPSIQFPAFDPHAVKRFPLTAAAAAAATVREGYSQEADAEYEGEDVVAYGINHKTTSADACRTACIDQPRCNTWVWCATTSGCAGGRVYSECWLKHKRELKTPRKPSGRRQPGIGWISGVVMSRGEYQEAAEQSEDESRRDAELLLALRANSSLPLVYFDVTIKGRKAGRIEMVLFTDTSPRCAENFRQFVTGEAGPAPQAAKEGPGMRRHFKGAPFYRIIDQFIDQSGVNTESVYGGQFKDDPGGLKLKHTRKGLLSMANMGPDTNTNHFSIMMGPAPHLDGHYTIFGQVVSGFDTVDAINALAQGKEATALAGAKIFDCGQLRKGTIEPELGTVSNATSVNR